jgi:hypothetical protein
MITNCPVCNADAVGKVISIKDPKTNEESDKVFYKCTNPDCHHRFNRNVIEGGDGTSNTIRGADIPQIQLEGSSVAQEMPSVAQEDQTEEHKPSFCNVCRTPLAFIKYGSKLGKDGRVAKWPVYEKCPNKLNPKYHPSAWKKAGYKSDDVVYIPKKDREGEWVGKLWQVTGGEMTPENVQGCIDEYNAKYGDHGIKRILTNAEGIDTLSWPMAEIVEHCRYLTPNVGYLVFIPEMEITK